MTRALVTQMLEALVGVLDKKEGLATQFWSCSGGVYEAVQCDAAIEAAREYLATEPIGERADSAQWLREFAAMEFSYYSREATMKLRNAADMLEADAQPKQVTCQIYGHVVGACVECNTHIDAQQAKRAPMSADAIYQLAQRGAVNDGLTAIVREVEAHHHIGGDA